MSPYYSILIPLLLYKIVAAAAPTAQTLNGTYRGVHSPSFNQDFFLGIHILASSHRRQTFSPADSLINSWNGTIAATMYAHSCVGYDDSVDTSNMSEDCLYLNVIRPCAVSDTTKIPVILFPTWWRVFRRQCQRKPLQSFLHRGPVHQHKPADYCR